MKRARSWAAGILVGGLLISIGLVTLFWGSEVIESVHLEVGEDFLEARLNPAFIIYSGLGFFFIGLGVATFSMSVVIIPLEEKIEAYQEEERRIRAQT